MLFKQACGVPQVTKQLQCLQQMLIIPSEHAEGQETTAVVWCSIYAQHPCGCMKNIRSLCCSHKAKKPRKDAHGPGRPCVHAPHSVQPLMQNPTLQCQQPTANNDVHASYVRTYVRTYIHTYIHTQVHPPRCYSSLKCCITLYRPCSTQIE